MIDDCVNSKQLCKKLTCSKTLNCRSTDCENCVSLQLLITRSFSAVRVEKKEQCYDAKVSSEKNNTLYLWVSWVTSIWPFKKFCLVKLVLIINLGWFLNCLYIASQDTETIPLQTSGHWLRYASKPISAVE